MGCGKVTGNLPASHGSQKKKRHSLHSVNPLFKKTKGGKRAELEKISCGRSFAALLKTTLGPIPWGG